MLEQLDQRSRLNLSTFLSTCSPDQHNIIARFSLPPSILSVRVRTYTSGSKAPYTYSPGGLLKLTSHTPASTCLQPLSVSPSHPLHRSMFHHPSILHCFVYHLACVCFALFVKTYLYREILFGFVEMFPTFSSVLSQMFNCSGVRDRRVVAEAELMELFLSSSFVWKFEGREKNIVQVR